MSGESSLFLRRGVELVVVRGRSAVLGRSRECEVLVDAGGVSRRHCEVVARRDGFVVRDLDSRHGTYVDGRRLAGETHVGPGAVLGLGARGPRIEVVGAVIDGERVVGGGPVGVDLGSPPRSRFAPGFAYGFLAGVVAGVSLLALADVSPWIAAAREALGR